MNWRCRQEQNPFLFFLCFFGLRVSYPSAHAPTLCFPALCWLTTLRLPRALVRVLSHFFGSFFPGFFTGPGDGVTFSPGADGQADGMVRQYRVTGVPRRGDEMRMKKYPGLHRGSQFTCYYCNIVFWLHLEKKEHCSIK